MMWRHGDVLIMAVESIPDGGEKLAQPVLAYGEVTGHTHRVEDAQKGEVWRVNDELFLKVIDVTRIIHEEHQPIELPPGCYRVWQQREYVPPSQRRANGINFRTIID